MGYDGGLWTWCFPFAYQGPQERPLKKLVVPEDYMHGEEDFIADIIIVQLKGLKDDQTELEGVHMNCWRGSRGG